MNGFNVINYIVPTTFFGLGGSITYGMQADAGLDWLSLLEVYRNKHDQQQFIKTNKGVPATGSWYGCVRLQTDIIDNAPTQVYLEFAVNDANNDRDKGCAEAIIRRIWTALPLTKICCVFFPKVADETVDDATNLSNPAKLNWIALCSHYKIPYIDYAAYLKSVIDAGGTLSDYMADTAHPTNAGHALAYSQIKSGSLSPLVGELPARLIADSEDFENTPIITNGIDRDGVTGTWAESGTDLVSSEADATITFSGTFRVFGLDLNTSGGRYAWNIDGGAFAEKDVPGYSNQIVYTGTTREAHTVVIKVVSGEITLKRFLAI